MIFLHSELQPTVPADHAFPAAVKIAVIPVSLILSAHQDVFDAGSPISQSLHQPAVSLQASPSSSYDRL